MHYGCVWLLPFCALPNSWPAKFRQPRNRPGISLKWTAHWPRDVGQTKTWLGSKLLFCLWSMTNFWLGTHGRQSKRTRWFSLSHSRLLIRLYVYAASEWGKCVSHCVYGFSISFSPCTILKFQLGTDIWLLLLSCCSSQWLKLIALNLLCNLLYRYMALVPTLTPYVLVQDMQLET